MIEPQTYQHDSLRVSVSQRADAGFLSFRACFTGTKLTTVSDEFKNSIRESERYDTFVDVLSTPPFMFIITSHRLLQHDSTMVVSANRFDEVLSNRRVLPR